MRVYTNKVTGFIRRISISTRVIMKIDVYLKGKWIDHMPEYVSMF